MTITKYRIYGYLPILLILAVGISLLLAFPHLASAYHLEAAGRAINNPASALDHLQRALRWDADNAQAYRLLGKIRQAQGNPAAAVEAFTHYAELRPGNPLGYIELAEAHEELETEMTAMRFADLVSSLPQADVQEPELPVDTPYSQPGNSTEYGHVNTTTFILPPGFQERATLFMVAPSGVTYTLALPLQPTMLRFGVALAPEVHDAPGDGAAFAVFVNNQPVFQEYVDRAMARQGWHERSVDLTPWAGQEIDLALIVTPGPTGDITDDWAGWGKPQIVDIRLPELEALRVEESPDAIWRKTGLTTEEILARGEAAREAEMYEEARTWYQRAIQLEPYLADPWYYIGLASGNQGKWQQALEAFETALTFDHFVQVGRSNVYYSMGQIYQRRLEPPQLDKALEAYETSLTIDDFSPEADEAWVHARLGQVYFDLQKNATAAEQEMLRAVELAPAERWLYLILGDFYASQGRSAEAETMYVSALEIDPEFDAARKRLEQLDQ